MPAPVIDIRNLASRHGGGSGNFSHNVTKGVLHDSSKTWFNKEMESPETARLEVLAQEFFRLIISTQPETRIARHPVFGTYYILSEEVPGYRDLPTHQQAQFATGTYTGLGQVMLTAVVVQEIDLKNGNVGLNKRNQVIKIDGDWTFVSIKDPRSYAHQPKRITPELLNSLPFPVGFYAYNWLDIKQQDISYAQSKIVDANLANAPHFRNEMNQAMLKILLLPDSYLRSFVDAYMPYGASADRFYDYLSNRREELKLSAMQNESFRSYLAREAAKNDARDHLIHMKGFVANGTHTIVKRDDYPTLEHDFKKLRDELFPRPRVEITKLSDVGDLPVRASDELYSTEQRTSFVGKTWKGFLGGFLIAASATTSLIALRVIDVFTFGLSLPLTIAASAGIVTATGIGLGLIGGASQYTLSSNDKDKDMIAEHRKPMIRTEKPKVCSTLRGDIVQYKDKTSEIDIIIAPSKATPIVKPSTMKTDGDQLRFNVS